MLKSEMRQVELDSIRTEIQTLAVVDHINIINYIESFEDERYIYIVMEYIEKSKDLLDIYVQRMHEMEDKPTESLFPE